MIPGLSLAATLTMFGLDEWSPATTAVLLGFLTLFVALRYASGRKLHPDEPMVLPPWIPFVGHLIGMALQGGRYIKQLGLRHSGEPIFTLPVPGSRIYVVTEPSLAAAVQRNSKTLSFTPLVPDITKRVLGLDERDVEIVRQNLDPEPGHPRGFLADVHDVVYDNLGPGPYLNSLSCSAIQELGHQVGLFESILRDGDQSTEPVNLLLWIRHLVTVSTAKYLLGSNNPIADNPDLEDAFWAFDNGLGGLLMGILPSLTAPKAYRGRERMVDALLGYLEAGHLRQASKIVQDRIRIETEYGMSSEMMARSLLSFLFAGIVNTTTTTFWVVLRLFADSELLLTVRQEILETLSASEETTGSGCISIELLKHNCPNLQAVFRESLRVGSENFSVRLIKDDMLLADRYFLKKGAVLQIAGGVIHADKCIWGDDVHEFNHRRFLSQKARAGGIHPAAFRGFGGGKTLCPGRHFATNEILMFAAMIVHGFDMTTLDGSQIAVPRKNDGVLPVHVLEPSARECPRVIISARAQVKSICTLKIIM